jgi:hypothetical protein
MVLAPRACLCLGCGAIEDRVGRQREVLCE